MLMNGGVKGGGVLSPLPHKISPQSLFPSKISAKNKFPISITHFVWCLVKSIYFLWFMQWVSTPCSYTVYIRLRVWSPSRWKLIKLQALRQNRYHESVYSQNHRIHKASTLVPARCQFKFNLWSVTVKSDLLVQSLSFHSYGRLGGWSLGAQA